MKENSSSKAFTHKIHLMICSLLMSHPLITVWRSPEIPQAIKIRCSLQQEVQIFKLENKLKDVQLDLTQN